MRNVRQSQRGQVLVLVALALLALVAILALAVDAGNVYQQRRKMQNAADTGALAGAGELCFGSGSTQEAINAATDYTVARNGADDALITVTQNVTVTVVASKTVDTFLAGVIGFRTIDVNARASAVCGAAQSGTGLWPVAFEYNSFVDIFNHGAGCGKDFYVWTSDKIDCSEVNCDIDGDGVDDVLGGGDRGWLDFTAARYPFRDECDKGQGCGADELSCRIEQSDGYLEVPTCVAGRPGVVSSMQKPVNLRIGDVVQIPLFTAAGCEVSGGGCTSGVNYWVTAFGCVRVMGWETKLDGFPNDAKFIRVRVECEGCSDPYGTAIPRPPEPWEMGAVSLVE